MSQTTGKKLERVLTLDRRQFSPIQLRLKSFSIAIFAKHDFISTVLHCLQFLHHQHVSLTGLCNRRSPLRMFTNIIVFHPHFHFLRSNDRISSVVGVGCAFSIPSFPFLLAFLKKCSSRPSSSPSFRFRWSDHLQQQRAADTNSSLSSPWFSAREVAAHLLFSNFFLYWVLVFHSVHTTIPGELGFNCFLPSSRAVKKERTRRLHWALPRKQISWKFSKIFCTR